MRVYTYIAIYAYATYVAMQLCMYLECCEGSADEKRFQFRMPLKSINVNKIAYIPTYMHTMITMFETIKLFRFEVLPHPTKSNWYFFLYTYSVLQSFHFLQT